MMGEKFTSFIILAAMRTGSNYLEANLNRFADIKVHGELFNPGFVGKHNQDAFCGITIKEREQNPTALLEAIKAESEETLPGFRFFRDHDPRIFTHCMNDVHCAKIILTRNPLDSFVSLKIARETDQWRLTNVKNKKQAKIDFNADEFEEYLGESQAFQQGILNDLQKSSQTGFYIHYEDIGSLDVLNGLAKYLGSVQQIEKLDHKLKRQNPQALGEKVRNFEQMKAGLGSIDHFNLSRTPNFEVRRGAAVPRYVLAKHARLLFMPIMGSTLGPVTSWMAAHEKINVDELTTGLKRADVSKWLKFNPNHQCFTVLRHPVARAYDGFLKIAQAADGQGMNGYRKILKRDFDLDLSDGINRGEAFNPVDHRRDFLRFLKFLQANLAGQMSAGISPGWATQSEIVAGFSSFLPPKHIILESDLAGGLANIERQSGLTSQIAPIDTENKSYSLGEIYCSEIEEKSREIYARDFRSFGFQDWRPDRA